MCNVSNVTETNQKNDRNLMTTPAEKINEFQDKSYSFELYVNEDQKVYIFHNKPLKSELSWLEFDLSSGRLEFVMADGENRDIGVTVPQSMTKNMQNAHQILMVLTDEVTGEALEGEYFPLILHREY